MAGDREERGIPDSQVGVADGYGCVSGKTAR
jgi:hypothetical protein